MRALIQLAVLYLFLTLIAFAQPSTSPASSPTLQPNSASTAQSANEIVPVPEPSEKALRYHRSGLLWWAVNLLWGAAIPDTVSIHGLFGANSQLGGGARQTLVFHHRHLLRDFRGHQFRD